VQFNVYILLLPLLFPSLTFCSLHSHSLHKHLTLSLHYKTCFPNTFIHQYATFYLPQLNKQFTFTVLFFNWRDIAYNSGMIYNAHQSGHTLPHHSGYCL